MALIADITSRLELLHDVREAAVCLWHQYFATRSFEHSDPFPLVCASVSLACKSLDQPRSVQVSANAFDRALSAGVSRLTSAAVKGHNLFQLLLGVPPPAGPGAGRRERPGSVATVYQYQLQPAVTCPCCLSGCRIRSAVPNKLSAGTCYSGKARQPCGELLVKTSRTQMAPTELQLMSFQEN